MIRSHLIPKLRGQSYAQTSCKCRAAHLPALFAFCCLAIAGVLLCTPVTSDAARVAATDFRDKHITLHKPAGRIVCLIESALSGLYMLGVEQQVVGIPASIYNGSVNKWYAVLDDRIRQKKLPAPGNWDFVSLESVVALKPDLVIIWSQQTEAIAALEARGIPVYGVFLTGWEDVYKEMRDLGTLTGSGKRAGEVVAYTRAEVDRFASRVAAIPAIRRPGVYYMWAQGDLETSCGGSTVNELINLSGGRNVCGYIKSEHLVVNREKVIGWNPDLLVMWYNERKNPGDVLADPQWQSVRAIKTGRVHELPEVFLCDLWTLKFQFAVKMVAKWANPELFRDVDLEKEKQTMLYNLYGSKIQGM
jgi:iron complex transport system substrate-binding protein